MIGGPGRYRRIFAVTSGFCSLRTVLGCIFGDPPHGLTRHTENRALLAEIEWAYGLRLSSNICRAMNAHNTTVTAKMASDELSHVASLSRGIQCGLRVAGKCLKRESSIRR